ncbi:MAG: AEC family transporter, partial [Oscillospiraceae bacterium]|nr:AEC family transporter [Oscillospiraceae bacterium]
MPINFGLARNVGETIFVLVLYIILGFFMRKRGVIDDRVNTGLTKLFMLTSLPATILNAMFNQPYDSDRLRDILIVFFGIIVIYLIFAFVGLGLGKLFKLPRNRYGTYAMTLSFGNVGIMGFPVVGALWGGPGAFYASIVSVAYFVMLPTIGTWLTVKSAADENGEPVKYRLKMNLGLAASIVGLLFYFTQNFLPVWLIQFIRPAVVDGVGGGPLGRFIGGVAATMTP